MARMPGVPFSPPRSYSTGRPGGAPRFIVIHYTAGSESPSSAEDGASYDQRRTDGTSTHFFTDRNSIIQCVDTANRAHTALYHGNLWGIHIEQCGTKQTRAQWLDEGSRPMIRNAARVCAWAMRTHGIPLNRLITRQIRTGEGICGHYDVTFGFPEDGGTHEDPGTEYPWDILFQDIRDELAGIPEDDVTAAENWTYQISTDGQTKAALDWLKDGYYAGKKVDAMVPLIAALADKVGVVLGEVDGLEEGQAALLSAVQAIQGGDPTALANALKAALAPALLDALRDRLNS